MNCNSNKCMRMAEYIPHNWKETGGGAPNYLVVVRKALAQIVFPLAYMDV